jgi:AcrR family transcriptional regulator
MRSSKATKPRPGRPRQEEGSPQVRQRLVEAAIALAREQGFEAVGVRQIAGAAGVTPGMIAYYFGDKRGLYEAMLEATYQQLVERMRALLERPATGGDPIARLVDLQISTLADTPWLPPLLAREVLARESPLREFLAERLAKGPGVLVPQMLRREMAAGRIRADLDPVLLMLSILGLGMVPYLMHPVAGRALGYELDDEFRDRMITHVQALLARGLAPASFAQGAQVSRSEPKASEDHKAGERRPSGEVLR